MRTFAILQNLFIALTMIGSNIQPGHIQVAAKEPAAEEVSAEVDMSLASLNVSLRAATGATIQFKNENGQKVSAPNEEDRKIPYLVLNRNGVPTPGFERTLQLSLGNFQVPPAGLYVDLKVETQHNDPDQERARADRIGTWEERRFVSQPSDPREAVSLDFDMIFQRAFDRQGTSVRTPTDYYSYQITLSDLQGNPLRTIKQEYAFLLENQWRVPLPQVLEAAPGSAPKELVLYFCDMIPFQMNARDLESRLPRQEVERYIQTELIPAMVDAFVIQSNLWELPWYPEWSNFRSGEDPKALSVALGGAGTWFHGAAPSLGHALISIRVDGTFGEYASLTDGILSVFHHELFHNQQRNISLHYGGKGNISGKDQAWEFFSEGTAVLASLVGQPAVQLQSTGMPRSYLKRANAFIGSDGMIGGGLNHSYKEIPYHTTLYWRFLYEQCGGIEGGIEDPGTGMKVIRQVLESLYSSRYVDINSSTAAIQSFPAIIDAALQATPTCTYKSFDETLIYFTRAIYLLRQPDRRCQAFLNTSCGFFDPKHIYAVPNAEHLTLTTDVVVDGSIPSSFGLDLIELLPDPSLHGKSMQLVFENTGSPDDEFNIELWVHRGPFQTQAGSAETYTNDLKFSGHSQYGKLVIDLGKLSAEEVSSFDLVITRTDTQEAQNAGQYAMQIQVK